jgi:Arc/MetJ-type ribon-helix-helix transcriptional regulator
MSQMATVEEITIGLTRAMAGLVGDAVETGEYASTSEVIAMAWRMEGRP